MNLVRCHFCCLYKLLNPGVSFFLIELVDLIYSYVCTFCAFKVLFKTLKRVLMSSLKIFECYFVFTLHIVCLYIVQKIHYNFTTKPLSLHGEYYTQVSKMRRANIEAADFYAIFKQMSSNFNL